MITHTHRENGNIQQHYRVSFGWKVSNLRLSKVDGNFLFLHKDIMFKCFEYFIGKKQPANNGF